MNGLVGLVAFAVGAFVGGAATGLVAWWRMSKLRTNTHADREVAAHLERDRDVISEEFTGHAVAVRKQVSEYADHLAGDNPVLRERLRQFEVGAQPC